MEMIYDLLDYLRSHAYSSTYWRREMEGVFFFCCWLWPNRACHHRLHNGGGKEWNLEKQLPCFKARKEMAPEKEKMNEAQGLPQGSLLHSPAKSLQHLPVTLETKPHTFTMASKTLQLGLTLPRHVLLIHPASATWNFLLFLKTTLHPEHSFPRSSHRFLTRFIRYWPKCHLPNHCI